MLVAPVPFGTNEAAAAQAGEMVGQVRAGGSDGHCQLAGALCAFEQANEHGPTDRIGKRQSKTVQAIGHVVNVGVDAILRSSSYE